MKRIPEEMENLILEMLQEGETYKAIVARTGVSESTVGRVARDNGICRIKRDIENEENNYPQELMEEWDRKDRRHGSNNWNFNVVRGYARRCRMVTEQTGAAV